MERKRIDISALIRAGKATGDIMKTLNVSKATVCRVRKRLADGEDLKDKPRSGRPLKIQPEAVKAPFIFMSNPKMKMSELAKKKSVDPSTISKAVKKAGGKSLRMIERPLLTQRHQEVREERCKRILANIKHNGNRVIFSDEKTFTVDPVINKQNDRVISFGRTPPNMRSVSKTKHPASVMMLGIVASTGDKMRPIWFPTGYRLTEADYLKILKTKVLPWILKILKKSGKSKYVFQQDGAPAHTCKLVQEWMKANMNFWEKTMWPPKSPNLNPLDFRIWWHVESKACRTRHCNVEELKASTGWP